MAAIVPVRTGADRRALRRVAAALCRVLAGYCIVATGVTLGVRVASGEPAAPTLPAPGGRPLPLIIPVIFLMFLLVAAAVPGSRRR